MKINFILIFIYFLSIKKIHSISCSPQNCPPLQGICYKNQCVCSKDFVTVNNQYIKNYGISCNYQTKNRFIAFLLEFFFPFGVGHLYAEKKYLAIIKFSFFLIFLFGYCGQLCCLQKPINKGIIFVSVIFLLDLLLWILMQIFDIICYALGYYYDGNGVIMN